MSYTTAEYKCPRCPSVSVNAKMPSHFRRKRHRLAFCRGSGRPGELVVRLPIRENDFAAFEAKLVEMMGLQNGWDSYGGKAPNKLARSVARDLGSRLYAANLKPSRVVPIAIGGVAIFLHRELSEDPRIVDIEVDNDGDVIVCIGKDGARVFQLKSEQELNKAMEEILDYFEKPVDTEEFSQ